MIIERQYDARKIDGFLNHPEVYEAIAGPHVGPFSMQYLIDQNLGIILAGEFGGFVVYQTQPGTYGFHTAVVPEGRGRWAMRMFIDGLRWMFTRTDAVELMTHRPAGNLAALTALKRSGASHELTTRPLWPINGILVKMDVYAFRIQEWAKSVPGMTAVGRDFHETLERKTAGTGKFNHEDDDLHDRYVGIAIEMIRNGQTSKGVGFYNRWAAMAGYKPIVIRSTNPLTIDIWDAIIEIWADDFEVVNANRRS